MEAIVRCRFYDGRQAEDERTKVIVQSAYSSAIERSTIVMNGRDCDVSMQCDLLLSCDSILKSDRYCQLSGSRSNSLNSCKFPGRFS